MILLTIYSKPDCHLCDEMKQVIEKVRAKIPCELQIKNILDDPADFEKYKTQIPVLFLNGSEIARYRISASRLEAALRNI